MPESSNDKIRGGDAAKVQTRFIFHLDWLFTFEYDIDSTFSYLFYRACLIESVQLLFSLKPKP